MKHFLNNCLALLIATFSATSYVDAAPKAPDISGIWLPIDELSDFWDISKVTLTSAGKEKFTAFDSQRFDSTLFCLPYGTPRNTLNTAPYPIEILQTEQQVTFLFDRLGDIRRIFLDGREHPEDPIPNWMGHSIGNWQNSQLNVNTVAMTAESILSDKGFPHTESMQLEESFALIKKNKETLLHYQLTLNDSQYYQKPLTANRYFRRVTHYELGEGSGLCLLDQWRKQLETFNRAQFRQHQEQ